MDSTPQVAIIELGSQSTLLIARTLRDLQVRSITLDPKRAETWLKKHPIKGVILSGGAKSVYDENAPKLPPGLLDLRQENGLPITILGICYGHQWLAHHLGGTVENIQTQREYGDTAINLTVSEHALFEGTAQHQTVWMNHGDSVTAIPVGFDILAYSDSGAIAAMAKGNLLGVQFHPEVTQTQFRLTILGNFLKIAGCETDWEASSVISDIRHDVLLSIGPDEKVILGFSGGVDSTTLAAILSPVLGERLVAITIDGGNLREGELHEIRRHAWCAGVTTKVIDARERFNRVLSDVTDAQTKRQLFKKIYTEILIESAHESEAVFVLQGTLAPDKIESGETGGDLIKSHHNVGNNMGLLYQLHPIADLFKDEVRSLAEVIGLPPSVFGRQPFPGPGLFIRVVGTPATPDKLDIVRWADNEVRRITQQHGLYSSLSQLCVCYVGVNTVGIKGDARAYGGAIVIRAVGTVDFLTAEGVYFPEEMAREISSTLTKHRDIVRVWYDPTDKPPGTVELE